jgi:ATP-dependent helicase/nuclease subunit B
MLTEASTDFEDRRTLVVSGSLAAQQWEAHLATREVGQGTRAWITAPLIGYSAWLDNLWHSGSDPRPTALTSSQALALWRRVIGASSEAAALVGHEGAASWAAEAWQLLCHWRIDPASLRPGDGDGDFKAFLGWCREYRRALADRGWVDRAEIARLLPTADWLAPTSIAFVDLDEPAPLQRALVERLERAGTRIEHLKAPAHAATKRRAQLGDSFEEIRAAAAWARRRLATTPSARLALVVPDLNERRGEVERAFGIAGDADAGGLVWIGSPLGPSPRVAAALNALALGSETAGFEVFSRWLRSPFFGDPAEHAARATFECRLRREVRAQLPFMVAHRETALEEALLRHVPATAGAIAAALRETTGIGRASPSRWARAWQRALSAFGWDGPHDARALREWQTGVEDFTRLTPITGEIEHGEALAELSRALERAAAVPLPLRGIHVLTNIDDVGPGYDGAWVTGFSDRNWPEPARCNPLLPRALQRMHAMPWSTPHDARRRCERRLARIESRVQELIASWPKRVYDFEAEPSPVLASWRDLEADELAGTTAAKREARHRETVDDPPPALPAGAPVHGGASTLRLQARCPLRAFCEIRLGAHALERVRAGLGARFRGTATHKALELLLADRPAQSAIADRLTAVPAAVERALREVFRDAQRPLRALFEVEAERMSAAVTGLLRLDLDRAPFTVDAVERQEHIDVTGHALRMRIDRVDRLADDSVAIIDYKTGDRASLKDWLNERPRDLQVPLYAAYCADPVGATVLARVSPLDPNYFGYWNAEAFRRGARAKLPDQDGWAPALAKWRAAVEELVLEHAGGDARLLLDDMELAEGSFAPLTRVHEQLAIVRGSAVRW